jgi:hypothetical protein
LEQTDGKVGRKAKRTGVGEEKKEKREVFSTKGIHHQKAQHKNNNQTAINGGCETKGRTTGRKVTFRRIELTVEESTNESKQGDPITEDSAIKQRNVRERKYGMRADQGK